MEQAQDVEQAQYVEQAQMWNKAQDVQDARCGTGNGSYGPTPPPTQSTHKAIQEEG